VHVRKFRSLHLGGIKVVQKAPPVNHLLPVDDNLLFFKGNREGADELFTRLEVYCET
jgi:hypothetical protein